MSRKILADSRIHPEALKSMESLHADVISKIESAVAANDVVVVGMSQNPYVGRARKALTEAGVAFEYLEFGSYFSMWRPRLAIKLWSGWPTFPQVFVKGRLIGGCTDLQRLMASGEIGAKK
jgi:glutaredoxin-related protein